MFAWLTRFSVLSFPNLVDGAQGSRPDTGRIFYYNKVTKEATWRKPTSPLQLPPDETSRSSSAPASSSAGGEKAESPGPTHSGRKPTETARVAADVDERSRLRPEPKERFRISTVIDILHKEAHALRHQLQTNTNFGHTIAEHHLSSARETAATFQAWKMQQWTQLQLTAATQSDVAAPVLCHHCGRAYHSYRLLRVHASAEHSQKAPKPKRAWLVH